MIKTKDFILRKAKAGDQESLWKNYNEETVMESFAYNPSKKKFLSDFQKGIKEKRKDFDSFIIEIEKEAAGKITLKLFDKYNLSKAKIGYWIGKQYRKKGLVTKIVKKVVPFWMKKYKLVRIEARVRTFNKASVRVLEKSGFTLEGIQKKSTKYKGRYYDDYIYAKIK